MKTQYRIVEQHNELKNGRRISHDVYVPQFRNIWTLFIWKKLHPFYGVFGSMEEAEAAIEIHKGTKTVKKVL